MSDKSSGEPTSLKGLLGGAAARFGLDDALAAGKLWSRWHEVVGLDVASHAEPTSLRGGVLRLRADSPVWAHEIGYLSEEIKQRANQHLGRAVVTEVRVWSAPGEAPSRPRADAVRKTAEPPSEASEPGFEDPREALEKARSAWLARRDQRRLEERRERG
ncbi:MAG: DUF721 domain-containing protein [Actinomycetota bacterium]|nr:DUF721 domain-containing protein [Actinomycetota bacterium]